MRFILQAIGWETRTKASLEAFFWMKLFKNKIDDFFKWVKGTELVELTDIDVSEDPVRPELDLERLFAERKIYGLKYENNIEAIVCVAYTNEVPTTVREMDYMSQVAVKIINVVKLLWHIPYGQENEVQVEKSLISYMTF